MTGTDWAIIIASIFVGVVQVVGAVFAGLAMLRSGKAVKVAQQSVDVTQSGTDAIQSHIHMVEETTKAANEEKMQKLEEIKKQTNGLLNQVVESVAKEQRAKGYEEGKADREK